MDEGLIGSYFQGFRLIIAFFLPLVFVFLSEKRRKTPSAWYLRADILIIGALFFVIWYGIPNVGDSDSVLIGTVEKELETLKWKT